jgi:hypothetical protein
MSEAIYSTARLPALGSQTTAVIHENLTVALTFVFSREAMQDHFGWLMSHRWYVNEDVFVELPKQRATRALIELAVMFRALDEVQTISTDQFITTHPYPLAYGDLYDLDGKIERLPLEEVPNKIIHAEAIDWDFSKPKEPLAVCHAAKADHKRYKWTKATISITSFAAVCGMLASSS